MQADLHSQRIVFKLRVKDDVTEPLKWNFKCGSSHPRARSRRLNGI